MIQLSVAGALEVQRRNETRLCPAGFAALMWYGERSDYAVVQGHGRYESRWLMVDGPGLLDVWRDLIHRCDGIVGPDRDGRLQHILERLTALRSPCDIGARISLCFDVLTLVQDLYRLILHPRGRNGVERAMNAIRADPYTCGSLTDLARRHGCSREGLVRRFTTVFGETPHRWLVQKRLERARRLLADPGLSVAEVAHACGWDSARGLARALGRAPSTLRVPAHTPPG